MTGRRAAEDLSACDSAAAFREAAERAEFVANAMGAHGSDAPALLELERRTSEEAIKAGRDMLAALEVAVPMLREDARS